jgi:N-acyl-D-amino-acid deacylase
MSDPLIRKELASFLFRPSRAKNFERVSEHILLLIRYFQACQLPRDESDRHGMSLIIELKRGAQPRTVLNQLHKYTPLQSTFGAQMLALVEDAREGGLDVTFDGYPYAYSSTRLNIVIPQWAFDGGLGALRRNLADPAARARMKQEMGPRAASWHDMWVTHFKRPEHHRFEGRSLAEVAELMGLDVVDAICELLLLEDQQVSIVSAGANMATMPRFVGHPLYMVGSDAVLIGDYPSPRTYGAFAIILAEWVREERWLGLPDAIRKMTSFPAQRLGLPDRGLLRDGFKADVVVFDAETVKAPATRREPKQFAIGIEQVLVNGRVVVDQGQHTGALAGRALRRGRAST